jgi:RNA polymerase sigma-70 factor (ECF subfamily)
VDAGRFEATRWSIVVAAGGVNSERARKALEHLCAAYWYPLYAFARREGHGVEDAQDLTQGFFARLLEKQDWARVDRERGKFRSFLLAAMKHYLANEWDRARAQKRGGGQTVLSLDAASAEQRYGLEPVDTISADQLYDRRWALTMLDQSLARVRMECAADGNARLFDEIKGSLAGGAAPQAEIAARLGMSEGALSVAIHRLRKRCREALRALIAETVNTDADVDDEMQQLLASLRR